MTGPRPAYFGGKARPPARYNPHGNVLPAVTPKPRAPYRDPALTLVEQILALQQKPLDAAEARRQQQVGIQQHDLEAARSALVAQLQQGAQTGGAAYDQAIGQTDALGRQAASYFQSQNPDAETQRTLRAIGAPVAQQQALHAQDAALFNGGPNYVLGAQIPGASLAAQKAAHVGELAGLPTVAALQGQLGERDLLGRSADAHAQYTQGLQQILAQAPQLVHQYQAEAQSQAAAAQSAQAKAAAAYANAQYLAQKLGLQGKQLDLATQKEQHAYEVATRQANIAANRANTYATGTNNTDLNAQERNRIASERNRIAQTKAQNAANAKAGKGRTTAIANRRKARASAINKVLGIKTATTENVGTAGNLLDPPRQVKTPRKYAAIFQEALGRPEVQAMKTAYGFSDAQVRQLIEAALASKGIKRPPRKRRPQPKTPLNPLGT